jgi:hypothetical protein
MPSWLASVAVKRGACFGFGMKKAGKAEKWAARSERLSAALRENLKRRKAQARGRAAAEPDDRAAAETSQNAEAPDFRRNPGNE